MIKTERKEIRRGETELGWPMESLKRHLPTLQHSSPKCWPSSPWGAG